MWLRLSLAGVVLVLAGSGCARKSDEEPDDPDAAPPDAGRIYTAEMSTVPPLGQAAVEAWLAEGHHKKWKCESKISRPRGNGVHGRHRICSNGVLLASTRGSYPVGASSVKELFNERDEPYGFAVGVKVVEGGGNDTWYWYERIGTLATLRPVADSVGDKTCGMMCHAGAMRDNVFIRAE